MRQHVLQVRKSQDMHHGIMGIRRILLGGPWVQRTGVLPYLRLEVAHAQQGVSVCKMVGER